jgi:hypothetical protein
MNDPSFNAPLVFEHLVQVNDSGDPRLEQLSRRQLWRGLVQRAERPRYFTPWLVSNEITKRADGSWERELDFGSFRVRDRVDFQAEQSVRYQVLESGVATQATLTMRIEEPAPGELFVRFIYSVQSPDHDAQSPLAGFVRDAYRCADEDTIGGIRVLAASGLLDQ